MRTEKEKGIICFLLTFFAFIGVFAGVYRPNHNVHAAEDFRLWRQLDDRWGDTPMGGTTVRRSGCYVTSIAMVAVASGARSTDNFDPGVFARTLNNMGAFSWDGGLMAWASVNRAVPEISIATGNIYFKSGDQSGKAQEMKAYLDKGQYVICNVGGHWVYVDGVIGSDVYMADPAKDEILMFKAYGNGSINCFQVLNGKNPYKGFVPLNSKAAAPTATAAQTTAAVSTTTTAVTTAASEYYCKSGRKVSVYSDTENDKSSFAELADGNVVNVLSTSGNYGEVYISGKKGWIELSELNSAECTEEITPGDVNNNGFFDKYDLALINEYIATRDKLPEGVSVLTQSEIKAADINGDGKIDNADVLIFLMKLC